MPHIELIQGDITHMAVDAIVNAANTDLQHGAGVAGAIRKMDDGTMDREGVKLAPVPLGGAVATRCGGKLKAKWVIHACGMRLGGQVTEKSLRDSIRNSLARAEEKKLKTIAFPAIGIGYGGFPVEECAAIFKEEFKRYFEKPSSLERVWLVLYNADLFKTFKKIFTEDKSMTKQQR